MWTPRFCSHCSLTRRPHFCSLTHFSSADKTGFLPGSWYVTYTCQAEASRQPRGSIFKRHFCNNNELTIHLQPVSLKGWASYEHAGRSTAIFTGHSLEKSVLIPGVGPAPLLALTTEGRSQQKPKGSALLQKWCEGERRLPHQTASGVFAPVPWPEGSSKHASEGRLALSYTNI